MVLTCVRLPDLCAKFREAEQEGAKRETLRPGATVDDFARAAMAEVERREGYEGELLTALENCRAPIKP